MSKKVALIFPGQGSQFVGMGKDFSENFSIARDTFHEADERLNFSLSQLIFNGKDEELMLTKNSQVAIYVVSVAIWRVLKEQFPTFVPLATAGLSLGEYTALTASGKLLFEEGVKIVRARGLYMHEAALRHVGTMAVCLGIDSNVVRCVIDSVEGVWIANLNCPDQVVISGTLEGIKRAALLLKKNGAKRVLPINVSGAFHSELMADAKKKLQRKIATMKLYSTTIPIVMNVVGDFVEKEPEIRQHLIDQVISPVYWERTICKMAEVGVEMFVELGCGKTLRGMNHKIGVRGATLSIEAVEDLKKLVGMI